MGSILSAAFFSIMGENKHGVRGYFIHHEALVTDCVPVVYYVPVSGTAMAHLQFKQRKNRQVFSLISLRETIVVMTRSHSNNQLA